VLLAVGCGLSLLTVGCWLSLFPPRLGTCNRKTGATLHRGRAVFGCDDVPLATNPPVTPDVVKTTPHVEALLLWLGIGLGYSQSRQSRLSASLGRTDRGVVLRPPSLPWRTGQPSPRDRSRASALH
jgi:hypothetical protein